VSIGFAEREKSDSVESLIGKADKALYQAKQHNRNRICMYVSKDETFLF
jgi:PleD family two-component response regulator